MPADDVVRNGQTVQYVTLSESFRGSLDLVVKPRK
jgi:hypothetical protein